MNKIRNIYIKRGCLKDVYKVFDKISEQNSFPWPSIIVGNGQKEQGRDALEILGQMQGSGICSD